MELIPITEEQLRAHYNNCEECDVEICRIMKMDSVRFYVAKQTHNGTSWLSLVATYVDSEKRPILCDFGSLVECRINKEGCLLGWSY